MPPHDSHITDPPALLAIARAARRTGDRDLERAARRALEDNFGIRVSFVRAAGPNANRGEAGHAR